MVEMAEVVESGWDRRRREVAATIELAALECLDEQPLGEVTVEAIATRAGVHVRTFFRYFPSREDVVLALPRRSVAAIAMHLASVPTSLTPIAALEQAVRDAERDLGEPRELRLLWTRVVQRSPELTARVGAETYSTLLPLLTDRFRSAYSPTDAGTFAGAALGALQHLFGVWVAKGGRGNLGEMTARGLQLLETAGRGSDQADELDRLRREVEELRAERDIFRRAALDRVLDPPS